MELYVHVRKSTYWNSQITDIEYLSCCFFLIWSFNCNIFFLCFSIIPTVTMLWSWGYEERPWDQSCLGLDSPIWNKDPKNMLYRSRFVKLFIISSYHVYRGHCRLQYEGLPNLSYSLHIKGVYKINTCNKD